NLLQALEALRSSTEIQQIQSEELVNDLKRANGALIKAFDKIKHKYTTRIKKLEDQLNSMHSIPSSTCSTSCHTTINTTTTSSCSSTTTTHHNYLSNTFKGCMIEHHNINEISKASIILNDMNNVNINSQIHPIYPMQSALQQQQQQPVLTTSTHSLNIPSIIDCNRNLSSIPTSHIPPIPQHQHQQYPLHHQQDHHYYPQIKQQPMILNTSQLRTTPLSNNSLSQQFSNLKHFPTH
ncbi:uncharacterized protein DC041_0011606, partial [Schistosoma bovis]